MKINIKVADGALSEREAIEIEFFISDFAGVLFGDDIEVEIEGKADQTVCTFPSDTGCMTRVGASILAAHLAAQIDNAIEEYHLPTFTVTVTHVDDSHPNSQTIYSYREVLGIYPWLLATLPTTWDEACTWSLEWVSGLTKITIR